MWLVAGLGNPGATYAGTRHNIGFDVIEAFASKHGFSAPKTWMKGIVYRKDDTLLLMPQTYMNCSGEVVGAVQRFLQVPIAQVIVVHDELDFQPGQVRIKVAGGHGGHNGLRSIIQHMGADFVRVRLGIGKPVHTQSGADYVLGRFAAADKAVIELAIDRAVDAIAYVMQSGAAAAMQQFHGLI